MKPEESMPILTFENNTGDIFANVHPNGLLQIFAKERTLRRICSTPDGSIQTSIITKDSAVGPDMDLIMGMNRMPLLSATYAGGREWHCDVDAGFQRLQITKTGTTISYAMKQKGFERGTITKILSMCRKHKWHYCPRQR